MNLQNPGKEVFSMCRTGIRYEVCLCDEHVMEGKS